MKVKVQYQDQEAQLQLIVVRGSGPSLFGRNWLSAIRLDWRAINAVKGVRLAGVLEQHSALFEPGLGTLRGYEAAIELEPNARPCFSKARPVSHAYRSIVEQELERLQQEGIIEPVKFADWAAPIVPVPKQDGKFVRICRDFKCPANRVSKLDRYPITKP